MKKLISLFVLVFTISMAMAQNTSTVPQTGNNKKADVSQTDYKQKKIVQVLSGSDPKDFDFAQQDNDDNRIFFKIKSTTCDNTVYIYQIGIGNRATGDIDGECNDVNILQQGDANFVGTSWNSKDGVSIIGNNNTVDIDQLTNRDSSINNITGNGNSITVTQN